MWAPLLVSIAVLIGANAIGAHLDGARYIGVNLAATACLLGVAAWAGLSAADLGLATSTLGAGAAWGLAAALIVVVTFTVGASVPRTRGAFRDQRVASEPPAATWRRALVTLPLGTVVLEEVAFRSVLLGLGRAQWSTVAAVAGSSLLFGLWHLRSAGDAHQANPHAVDALSGTRGRIAAIAIVVLSTGAAGVLLCWLRLRSGSLLAPALLHFSVNATGLALAMMVARQDRNRAGA
ncbi:MAG: CPBP family intramembrane glutamic endopeptidase [Acidimicrobiia bacterium]